MAGQEKARGKELKLYFEKLIHFWECPGGLMVRVPGFHCHGLGSIPGRGTEIPQAERCGKQKKERKKLK